MKEAIAQAHSHPAVLKIWEEFAAVCDYVSPASITELDQLFPDFEPMF